MTHIVSKPDHGTEIALVVGQKVVAESNLQLFFDDIMERLNTHLLGGRVALPSYTVATLPSATTIGLIFVTDETGGAVPAFSDGTNWRRVTDRAIVS